MINDCSIKTAEDEVVLRQYTISELDYRTKLYKNKGTPKRKKGKYNTTGSIYVTNRRLIYNIDNRSLPSFGLKCKDLHSQQIRIEDIQGIDFMSSTMRASLFWPIVMIALGVLLSLVVVGVPLLIIGALWLFIRLRNAEASMVFGIRSPSTGYSLFVSEMSRGYGGNVQYWCAPTQDFERMALELGAIVLDLQKYGDECISKWMSSSTASDVIDA